MLFRLVKGGPHTERDGKVYKVGNVIESETDLVKAFGSTGKFALVDGSPNNGGGADPSPDFGSDVTSVIMPAILESDSNIRIFQKSAWYSIVDMETGVALNEKKLRKSEVEQFVKKYIED